MSVKLNTHLLEPLQQRSLVPAARVHEHWSQMVLKQPINVLSVSPSKTTKTQTRTMTKIATKQMMATAKTKP